MSEHVNASSTPKAFVIGHPIAHSRSPLLHGFWLKKYAIPGSYSAIDIEPGQIGEFLQRIRTGEFVGGNVTIPHKEAVFALVDECQPVAQELGAVNTLWMENGRLRTTNTDLYGFLANLDQKAPGWDGNAASSSALIIGAGGAARAVVHGLKSRGFSRIVIANRTPARAEEIAAGGGSSISVASLDALCPLAAESSLIVNTTPIGMEGHEDSASKSGFLNFIDHAPANALVTDIVYTPLVTPLLARAELAGLRTVDGLGMLLHQAVPGFELWFGMRPQVDDALYQHVLNSIVQGKAHTGTSVSGEKRP